jgi:hypothetical protein
MIFEQQFYTFELVCSCSLGANDFVAFLYELVLEVDDVHVV